MIEEDLYQHLLDLDIKTFPQKAPDNEPLPYVAYTVISGKPRDFPSAEVRYISTLWQIDVYDDSAYKTKLLRESIAESIRDFPLFNGDMSWKDGYEPRVKTFRQTIEFKTKQYIGECNGD